MATATLAPPVDAAELEQLLLADDPLNPAESSPSTPSSSHRLQMTAVGEQLTLLSVLREHGIKAYRPEDIEAYKAEMVAVNSTSRRRRQFFRMAPLATVTVCAASSVLMPFTSGAVQWAAFIAYMSSMMIGLIILLVGNFLTLASAAWIRYGVDEYGGVVPRTARNLIAQLRRAIPNARLVIDELQVERRPLDPLLYVQLGGAEFCVAVWDEPRFDAPLMH